MPLKPAVMVPMALLLLKVNLFAQTGLVAFYPLDNSPNDYSGNAIHGTACNVTPAADRFGVPDHAYHFSGTNSAVIIKDSLFKLNSYTYSIWCKPTSLPSTGQFYSIFSVGGTVLDQALMIGNYSGSAALSKLTLTPISGSDDIGFGFGSYDTLGASHSCYQGSLPTVDHWYHIVVTRNNDSLKMYVDNSLICTKATGKNAGYQGNPEGASIGSRIDTLTQNFIGDIDDLKIFNRVLSASEIASLDSPAAVKWANFGQTVFTNGTAATIQFNSASSVDVTVTTGGTHGITGLNLGSAGVVETGLSYDSLYALTIFNGGGGNTVPTTIQFSNFHNIPADAIGYLGIGNVLYRSSPIHVSASAGVGAWTQTGGTFTIGTDSTSINWNAADSQFETQAPGEPGSGSDSRGITMSMGLLNQYTTVTLQLDQWLADGIRVWIGMDHGDQTSVHLKAEPRCTRPELCVSGIPLTHGQVQLDYNVVFPGIVCLAIHDAQGGLVRVLASRAESAGMHHIVWDGRNQRGTVASSGVYFATISAQGGAEAVRMVRIP
jgi:hypothetical protein